MKRIRPRSLALVGLVLVTTSISVPRAQEADGAPLAPAWQELGVVRVDHRNKRLFVVPPEGTLDSRENASAYLARVVTSIGTELPSWEDGWSVSFFSSASLAGYKTEFMEVDDEREAWVRAYLAEFDRQTKQLTYSPLNPKTVRYDVIELK